jgi:hypothetical protein
VEIVAGGRHPKPCLICESLWSLPQEKRMHVG